jgi:hypothetical protein
MKELFVSYALALELKKKGFDEPCFAYYEVEDGIRLKYNLHEDENPSINNPDSLDITAPLYQQIVDWLETEKNLLIDITHNYYFQDKSVNIWHIRIMNKFGLVRISNADFEFNTRQNALTKAIEESLKLI